MILSDESAEYTLAQMISEICEKLDDLKYASPNDNYISGLKTAYVECLEIIQLWEKSKQFGLNFHIETMYPI